MNLDVGDEVGFDTIWLLDGAPVTTGVSTIVIASTQDDGSVLYLQADKVTVNATPYTGTMTLAVDTWIYPLTIPDSMDDLVWHATKYSTVTGTYRGSVPFRVGLSIGGSTSSNQPSARFE